MIQGIGNTVLFTCKTREEFHEMKQWCKNTLGKSHGPGFSKWWIHSNKDMEIMMLRGDHMILATLTWR